jgi:hypothetical protein
MNRHILKTDPDVFSDTWNGTKTYELRKDDRVFEVGDTLILRETRYSALEMKEGKPLEYTGRTVTGQIHHKLSSCYGLKDGWCVLALTLEDFFGCFDELEEFQECTNS